VDFTTRIFISFESFGVGPIKIWGGYFPEGRDISIYYPRLRQFD
jgi:hypothetical protein